jgi:hypothetical protein
MTLGIPRRSPGFPVRNRKSFKPASARPVPRRPHSGGGARGAVAGYPASRSTAACAG